MMQNVPKADVVVTNPTHYAVALEYDREVMSAPRVTAKGADFIAERIKEIARENDVAIVENPPVAREIYRLVDIGQEVPEEFFRTVAEILAYVYRLKGKTAEPSSAGVLEDEPGAEENTEGPGAP
jgi:flagellar biosynthetic protein FlhB